MAQYYCLIAQKETKERDKIKCLIISCDITPEEYVAQLQENHCMEYQLVVYSFWSEKLENEVQEVCRDKKTGYGKNWYELSDTDLSAVISTHFLNGKVILDFTSIADVIQHTLNLMSIGPDKVHVVPNSNRSNVSARYHDQSLVAAPVRKVDEPVTRVIERVIERVPVVEETVTTVSTVSTNHSSSRDRKKHSSKRDEWEVKVGSRVIKKSDYADFIKDRCVKDGKIHTVKLNDNFIEYLTEAKKCKPKEFSHPDDREELFKGFPKLGYEIVDSGKRYYVQGLRLKKTNTK